MSEPVTVFKTIKCRRCKLPVLVSQGLQEMQEHWEFTHFEDLERLRERLGHYDSIAFEEKDE